jgi:hypothetical protein
MTSSEFNNQKIKITVHVGENSSSLTKFIAWVASKYATRFIANDPKLLAEFEYMLISHGLAKNIVKEPY